MRMGVVADDITGANDIGSMFALGGYCVHVYTADDFDPAALRAASPQPDVVIVDTNSRLDPPDIARQKVLTATRQLESLGCPRFFNKTCSVFRGNIGAEFDAMLDVLAAETAIVVLGYPRNGRLTIDGVHYVHGQRLEDSPFRNDPIHPMTQSSLVEILQAQTTRRVGLIDRTVIGRGSAALRQEIEQRRGSYGYLILDVPDQAALTTIAQTVADERVLCGSSALAEELPAIWGGSDVATRDDDLPPHDDPGIVCVAGSLTPQTAAQIEHLRSIDVPIVEIDTTRLIDPHQRASEIERVCAAMIDPLTIGQHVVAHAANDPQIVGATRALGTQHGLSGTEIARLVTDTLAEVTARTLDHTGGRRLVVAGGETSAAVCRRLGIHGLRIWHEIQPGLPSCLTLTDPPLLIVLKSGSFGTADFLEQAIAHLAAQ